MSDIEPILKELTINSKVLVRVMASPGKPRTKLKKIVQTDFKNDTLWVLYVDVAAEPVRGDANKELCIYLTKLFSNHTVTLRSGQSSREKYFLIHTIHEQ